MLTLLSVNKLAGATAASLLIDVFSYTLQSEFKHRRRAVFFNQRDFIHLNDRTGHEHRGEHFIRIYFANTEPSAE